MPFDLLRIEMLLPAFALVMARIAGIVLAVPMFSNAQIPVMMKALLVAIISLMIFPAVLPVLPVSLTLGHIAAGSVMEFVIGELLGMAVGVTLFAAQMAGNIVSHQAGITLGQVFNPLLEEETGILDQVWFFTVLMLFLAFRGHLALVNVILTSFKQVPPLMVVVDGSMADLLVGLLRSMFEVTMRLSGPAILALLLSSLVLGFLTKTMPQLNILSVGFSVKVAIGLVVVALTIHTSGDLIVDTFESSLNQAGLYLEQASAGVAHGR
jgi:flagellar biosynthetic protein FliR